MRPALPELFSTPDQMNKQIVKGSGMKDKMSTTMKKGPDDESKRISAMAREQKEQVQITGSKLGPLETLKKAQLEENMNKKGNAMGRDAGQQNEPISNNVENAKTKKGTGDLRRNNNQERERKNMG